MVQAFYVDVFIISMTITPLFILNKIQMARLLCRLDAASLEDFYYVVEDFASNTETAKVSDLVNVGNESGRVTINLLDGQTNVASYVDYTFIVKDHDGNVITDLKYYGNDLSTVNLPFGDYTVELALYDTDAAELAGPTSQIIKLSDADSYKTVNFYVHMRNQAALVLDFDKELPKVQQFLFQIKMAN